MLVCFCLFVFLLEITSVVRKIVDGPYGRVEKGDDEDCNKSQVEHILTNNGKFARNIIYNTWRNIIHNLGKCERIVTGQTKLYFCCAY